LTIDARSKNRKRGDTEKEVGHLQELKANRKTLGREAHVREGCKYGRWVEDF